MNACQSTMFDTDRCELGEMGEDQDVEMEDDAATIDHLEDMGFRDPLRVTHPTTRIVTRRLAPGSKKKDTMRYLDKIMVTSELYDHPSTVVGVYQPTIFLNDTDHHLVVADLPSDVIIVASGAP